MEVPHVSNTIPSFFAWQVESLDCRIDMMDQLFVELRFVEHWPLDSGFQVLLHSLFCTKSESEDRYCKHIHRFHFVFSIEQLNLYNSYSIGFEVIHKEQITDFVIHCNSFQTESILRMIEYIEGGLIISQYTQYTVMQNTGLLE